MLAGACKLLWMTQLVAQRLRKKMAAAKYRRAQSRGSLDVRFASKIPLDLLNTRGGSSQCVVGLWIRTIDLQQHRVVTMMNFQVNFVGPGQAKKQQQPPVYILWERRVPRASRYPRGLCNPFLVQDILNAPSLGEGRRRKCGGLWHASPCCLLQSC